MFGYFRRRAEERRKRTKAYTFGQGTAESIFSAVEGHLDRRLPEASNNLLLAFRLRLTTIGDEPDHSPRDVALIEHRIFLANVAAFEDRLASEVKTDQKEWFDLLDQIGTDAETRRRLDQHIHERISTAKTDLLMRALQEMADAVASHPERP